MHKKEAQVMMMLGFMVGFATHVYSAQHINETECYVVEDSKLICDYKGNHKYETNQALRMIKTLTFRKFGRGDIWVSGNHLPFLTTINILHVLMGSTEADVCKRIHVHNPADVDIHVGNSVCNTEPEVCNTEPEGNTKTRTTSAPVTIATTSSLSKVNQVPVFQPVSHWTDIVVMVIIIVVVAGVLLGLAAWKYEQPTPL